jgi:hypothetical protein
VLSARYRRDVRRAVLALSIAVTAAAVTLGPARSPVAAEAAPPSVSFRDAGARLVLTTPAYRLELGKRNGAVLALVERATGARIVRGSRGCGWSAFAGERLAARGCAFSPRGAARFSYAWRRGTLTLRYAGAHSATATVTVRPAGSVLDLRLTLANRGAEPITGVHFPADLLGSGARAGYVPTYLPGIRLGPGFFTRVGSSMFLYPSRWAFTDFLAYEAGSGQLSLSGVNPEPRPIQPVALGFVRDAPPGNCSGRFFCLVHRYETWVPSGATWTSPVVRLRVGQTVQRTILAHRRDNRFDRYPSAAAKLGALLPRLARAPLVKADPGKGLGPFRDWGDDLRRLPSPSLLHPVAFQPGGHDRSLPDVLPPNPALGTTEELRAALEQARALGHLVVPYLNVSWWNDDSPTLRALSPADVAARDADGKPIFEEYLGPGWVVSPHAPAVRDRVTRLLEEWRALPADCLFFDQLGARRWLRDFHPAAPSPLAYYDGWLSLLAPHAGRCLMAEDGWDRLAGVASALHGGALMLHREHDEPDLFFGAGNWEPYPLATWLLHDKVLMYQHDLFPGTFAADPEVLTWNLAFGYLHSSKWEAAERASGSPWLELAAALQRALGPHYAGVPLAGYRRIAPGLTESRFGNLTVVANRRESPHRIGGETVAPRGFLARTRDGRLLAGAFEGTFGGRALSPGTHYLLVRRDASSVTVEQPLGGDTDVSVQAPAGRPLRVRALAEDGSALGDAPSTLRGGRVEFRYVGALGGRRVARYHVSSGP